MTEVQLVGNANTSTFLPAGNAVDRALECTRDGSLFTADFPLRMALAGRSFYATDADANDRVTGQTSFAVTTPTFLLDVPSGTAAVPLHLWLEQAGTVAGEFIDVNIAISSGAIAYASSGTAEAIAGRRTDRPITPNCTFYSGATATTALLTKQVRSWQVKEDPEPVSDSGSILWTPYAEGDPIILVGPAAIAVFTYAGTTGPTWYWSFSWAEVPSTWVTG